MLYLLLAVMVAVWSGNFVVAKVTLREVPPLALVFLRIWIAAALLLVLYLFSSVRRTPLPRGAWKHFAGLGLLGVVMNQAGFTLGIHKTTVGHSSLIIALCPVIVLILAVRMKLEALTWRKGLGMALCFSGIVVLASEHGFRSENPTFVGDIITLGGSVAFALYTVYGKKVSTRYDTLTLNTFIHIAAAIAVLPIVGHQLPEVSWRAITWRGWLGVLYMAGMASVVAYMIFYYALTKIPASRVAVLTYPQPILATILGIFLLGEAVTAHLVAGGALVLAGVYLAERAVKKAARAA